MWYTCGVGYMGDIGGLCVCLCVCMWCVRHRVDKFGITSLDGWSLGPTSAALGTYEYTGYLMQLLDQLFFF